jgi:hypothetical protein
MAELRLAILDSRTLVCVNVCCLLVFDFVINIVILDCSSVRCLRGGARRRTNVRFLQVCNRACALDPGGASAPQGARWEH